MQIKVYQINMDRDKNGLAFVNHDFAVKRGGINPSIYDEVFSGEVDGTSLEDVFRIFNTDEMPITHRGHSLSVSDVVQTEDGCYYCDSFGFKKLDGFDASQVQKPEGLLKAVILEPGKEPYTAEIADDYKALQRIVGGLIEATYPFEDNAFVYGNDEAKLIGMEGNRRIEGSVYAGPLIIIGDKGDGDCCSLTDEQIAKYTEQFRQPEEISQDEVQADTGYTFYAY